MKYKLFEIGPFSIYSYGAMIAIGIVAAFFTADFRAKKCGLDGDHVYGLGFTGLAGGILGAKLLFYLTEIQAVLADPKMLLNFSEGFVVYGGIIGGILGAYLYLRIKKLPALRYVDLAIPSVALAQGFGRIGCFLAGCCYGRETDAWYGIMFHNSPFAPNGVSLIPTQLISSAADFMHFALLLIVAKRKNTDGMVTTAYIIFYSIGRFVIELLRNDPRGNVSIFSTSQFISIFMLAVGIFMFAFLRGKSSRSM